MNKSLEHKTIRPGSLSNYSYYYSNNEAPVVKAPVKTKSPFKKFFLVFLIIGAGYFGFNHSSSQSSTSAPVASKPATKTQKNPTATTIVPKTNECAGNTLDKFINVSISKRKLWACEGTKQVYSTPVITGIEKYATTETPKGTFKIYAKQQDTALTGTDETGSWRAPVSYWEPFLDNQYGTYGFHDATWRNPNEFGNVDAATSDKASHGCVELPTEASKWLYDWSQVGTTLTIKP